MRGPSRYCSETSVNHAIGSLSKRVNQCDGVERPVRPACKDRWDVLSQLAWAVVSPFPRVACCDDIGQSDDKSGLEDLEIVAKWDG